LWSRDGGSGWGVVGMAAGAATAAAVGAKAMVAKVEAVGWREWV